MGFSMHCINTGKSCSYSMWFEQRVGVILATVKYLEQAIAEIKAKLPDPEEDDGEYINGLYTGIDYTNNIRPLEDMINDIKHVKNIYGIFDGVYNVFMRSRNVKEGLVCFGVYGLYMLCNQSDIDGVYAVGESYEIIELLIKIKPYIDVNSDLYRAVYTSRNETNCSDSLVAIFNDSIDTKHPVIIR